jgi:hypothetical protein
MWNDSADKYNAALSVAAASGQNTGAIKPAPYMSTDNKPAPPPSTTFDWSK